jgi:CrcB protein
MLWKSILAVSLGASLGALLRWWLSASFNAHFTPLPPGTLASNLLGGFIVGVAVAYFATHTSLSAEWRLFVITGFCGGLTTFSTFSAEIVGMLAGGRPLWALATAAVHLCGSVLMTLAGIGAVAWLRTRT